jgi:hypothetical protein
MTSAVPTQCAEEKRAFTFDKLCEEARKAFAPTSWNGTSHTAQKLAEKRLAGEN